MRWLSILLVLAASPIQAQDPVFDPQSTEECLATDGGPACIGIAAQACMEQPGASTTVGMGFCIGSERDWWDARLNDVYRALMAVEKTRDAEMAEIGSSAPKAAPALKNMQRAWITFRDAACEYEYTQWGGGTGGGPAHAHCAMTLTATQTLALEARLEDR